MGWIMSRAAPVCHGRAYRRTASGANTALSSPHQASDPATGCATGQAEPPGDRRVPEQVPQRRRHRADRVPLGERAQPALQVAGRDAGVGQQRQHEGRAAELTGRLLAAGQQSEEDARPGAGEPEQQEQRHRAGRGERTRSLPWSEEQENAARIAYLGSQVATGACPRMAAAFSGDPGPIDLEAVFGFAVERVLDAFAPRP
ncbi:hypothetical protein [Streptomyces sp. NPDC017202]|uniref:hypothetical protein n=1 Tax=Streptomyces sp. NPDC017202 TaxID=3364981 RepID=UPI0037B8134A